MQQWIKQRTEIPTYSEILFYRNKFTTMTWTYNCTVFGGHGITLSDLSTSIWEKNFKSNDEYELWSSCLQLRLPLIPSHALCWMCTSTFSSRGPDNTPGREQNFSSGVPHTLTDQMQGCTKKCSSGCNREKLESSALWNAALLTTPDWSGLEGTIKIIPAPCHGQGHLSLNWVAQSPSRMNITVHSFNKKLFEIKMLNQGTGKILSSLCDCCV